jgi:hypothetical protein
LEDAFWGCVGEVSEVGLIAAVMKKACAKDLQGPRAWE